MGARCSTSAPSLRVFPAVSRYTFSRDDGDEVVSQTGSLYNCPPPREMITAWQDGLPLPQMLAPIPEADIMSDGEAEGRAWDMSVGTFESSQGSHVFGGKVRYVSAVMLHTPQVSFARKVQGKNACEVIC